MPNTIYFLAKWRIFAKSGHTEYHSSTDLRFGWIGFNSFGLLQFWFNPNQYNMSSAILSKLKITSVGKKLLPCPPKSGRAATFSPSIPPEVHLRDLARQTRRILFSRRVWSGVRDSPSGEQNSPVKKKDNYI